MDNKIEITPLTRSDLETLRSSKMNHFLMDIDREYKGDLLDLVENDLSYTISVNDVIIAASGMKRIWGNVAEGWVIATKEANQYPLIVARAIKKHFANVARRNGIKRVQTAVRADFGLGIRFAGWLGLENEGLMKNYGFDDSDHYRYARIF